MAAERIQWMLNGGIVGRHYDMHASIAVHQRFHRLAALVSICKVAAIDVSLLWDQGKEIPQNRRTMSTYGVYDYLSAERVLQVLFTQKYRPDNGCSIAESSTRKQNALLSHVGWYSLVWSRLGNKIARLANLRPSGARHQCNLIIYVVHQTCTSRPRRRSSALHSAHNGKHLITTS